MKGLTEISGRTKMLALIADPVVQARSPAMANELLRERGRLGEFLLLPLEVRAAALGAVITGLRQVGNFAGAIVSMPHKAAIVPLLDELTPAAEMVGAVNVVRRTTDGRLRGTVLDGDGFVAGLRQAGHGIEGTSCLLVGAGGAAAAIAFALAANRCGSLTITNRTAGKAAALAARIRAAFPSLPVRAADTESDRYDIAINATSLGMRPEDDLPMSAAMLARAGLIAECVISPEMTRLLSVASERGHTIHGGVPMLTAQMDLMLRFMGVE